MPEPGEEADPVKPTDCTGDPSTDDPTQEPEPSLPDPGQDVDPSNPTGPTGSTEPTSDPGCDDNPYEDTVIPEEDPDISDDGGNDDGGNDDGGNDDGGNDDGGNDDGGNDDGSCDDESAGDVVIPEDEPDISVPGDTTTPDQGGSDDSSSNDGGSSDQGGSDDSSSDDGGSSDQGGSDDSSSDDGGSSDQGSSDDGGCDDAPSQDIVIEEPEPEMPIITASATAETVNSGNSLSAKMTSFILDRLGSSKKQQNTGFSVNV